MTPLSARAITKAFGRTRVLDGVSLRVDPGETVVLLGPNGSGKSTLLGCICGTVVPDSGQIEIAGHDLQRAPIAARTWLRYLPQEVEAPEGLTGNECLAFYAEVYGVARAVDHTRGHSGLGESLERLASTYSVGMRRRLGFAAALTGLLPAGREGSHLLVLDEPFAGVDAEGRGAMRRLLAAVRKAGAGILVAAHDRDLADLEDLDPRPVEMETSSRTGGSTRSGFPRGADVP